MKVDKRTIKMPPAMATEEESRLIRHHLVDIGRSYSSYSLEAVLEKIARDRKAEPQAQYVRGAAA